MIPPPGTSRGPGPWWLAPLLALGGMVILVTGHLAGVKGKNAVPIQLLWCLGGVVVLGATAAVGWAAHGRESLLQKSLARADELRATIAKLEDEVAERGAADVAKGTLLRRVNHGFRAPLSSLKSTLRIMDGPAPPRAWRELMEMLNRDLERLEGVVNDLVDEEQLAFGGLVLRPVALPVGPALQEAILGVQSLAQHRRVEIRLEAAPEVRVWADPARFQQVLGSLLARALEQATTKGGIWVWADLPSEGRIRVSIHDPARAPAVPGDVTGTFVPFTSGLGLSLARSLAEAMGGRLGQVAVEEGNTTWFELPQATP